MSVMRRDGDLRSGASGDDDETGVSLDQVERDLVALQMEVQHLWRMSMSRSAETELDRLVRLAHALRDADRAFHQDLGIIGSEASTARYSQRFAS